VYEQFYHFSEDPFRLTPDPRYAFAHPSYAKARAYLEYGLQRGEGFVAVTGPPGSGKTTLIEELLTRAPPGVRVSQIVSSQLEAEDLLRMVSHSLGLEGREQGKALLLNQIRRHLEEDRINGRRTVLIVDEAQGLDGKTLEELRLLTNLADQRGPLLQIILLGQEQLRELLKLPELEQLRQRTIAAYHLKPMSEADTRAYIEHRLRCADWAGDPLISDMAVKIIHHAGGGNPRRVNLLCSRLLLHGYVNAKHYLAVPDVRIVLEEMSEEELASWDDSLEDLMQAEEAREQEEASVATQQSATPAVGTAAGWEQPGKPAAGPREPDAGEEPTAERGGGTGGWTEPLIDDVRIDPAPETAAGADSDYTPPPPPPPSSEHAPWPGDAPSRSNPEPGPLPDLRPGERLVETPRPASGGQTVAGPAKPKRSRAWEWVVGGALIFLLMVLVAATHDPTRRRIKGWLESAMQATGAEAIVGSPASSGNEEVTNAPVAPARDSGSR